MLNDLTTAQRKLADFMSDLSERCYYAGWLENLEYILWDALVNGERTFGHDKITAHDIDQLIQLAEGCNCWIFMDDKTEETTIDLPSWKEKFAESVADNPGLLKG